MYIYIYIYIHTHNTQYTSLLREVGRVVARLVRASVKNNIDGYSLIGKGTYPYYRNLSRKKSRKGALRFAPG